MKLLCTDMLAKLDKSSDTTLMATQVDRLCGKFAVCLVRCGRLCIAGLNSGNVVATARAVAAAMRHESNAEGC